MVDLSEFTETGETGLAITFEETRVDDGFANTYSDLNMTITGTARLFESFNSTQFTIHCISVFNNVNIRRSPKITFFDSQFTTSTCVRRLQKFPQEAEVVSKTHIYMH